MIEITEAILEKGKSRNNGWNMKQLSYLGIDELEKGWRSRLIGTKVSIDNLENFLEYKDAHLSKKIKVKKAKNIVFVEPIKKLSWKDQYKHPNWQKLRLNILERDNFKCKNCYNKEEILHVHHLCYVRDFYVWEVPPRFLVTLCETCHNKEHEKNTPKIYK